MLSKRYVLPTRDATAIGIADIVIKQSGLDKHYPHHAFTKDDLLQVVRHVEIVYGTFDERPDQFIAVVATTAKRAAVSVDLYGPFGNDTEREVAGRSSIRYWLDHDFADRGSYIKSKAKLPPPRFELDVAPESKSSARCCKGPGIKHKFGVGEPRLTLALWEPFPSNRCAIVREQRVTCCLDAKCVGAFEQQHGVSITNAVPATHLDTEALEAVEARKAALCAAKIDGAPPAPPKPDACFPNDRKREPTRYEYDINPWGELEVDVARIAAAGAIRAEEVARLRAELAPALDAEKAKRQREVREEVDEHRKKRYRPTLAAHKDAAIDDANPLCAYVFHEGPFGEPGPFKCPYDRKEGSPFCSQCALMVAALVA